MTATVVVLSVVGCARPPAPASSAASSPPASRAPAINPANIKRVGRELPSGYEVTGDIRGASPWVIWSLGAQAWAVPPQCAALADPGYGQHQAAQGVSGSGAGGIVDAVVVALSPGPVLLDHDLVASCGHWTMTDGHATASVSLTDAPHIDGAETLGMVADVRKSVEAGAEIDSRAYTFVAYLGDYYALGALTTDPGSMLAPLPPQFAADLLVKTVSTVRG
nr:DUF5642 family protein [Mycobacterium shinjukuense]